MLNDTFKNYTSTEYKIELQEEAQPYHAKPFLILKVHEETLKTKVDRLVNKDILNQKNNSE